MQRVPSFSPVAARDAADLEEERAAALQTPAPPVDVQAFAVGSLS
eukprot:CAMPEP_0180399292 /NCGR_PEP_ID=MMETSP0989-20121125/37089_1 /TAXON_ID=697907 /ORGANISM="non described non described, Strain CCMP2293" /LENGTH=44 /DNA_ID= /DNA_START= /DNA_END= /DNA_ORIENTATION=